MNFDNFLSFLDLNNKGYVILDNDNIIKEISSIGEKILDISKEYAIDKNLYDLFPDFFKGRDYNRCFPIAFNKYIKVLRSPDSKYFDNLPKDLHLLIFEDATNESNYDIFTNVVDNAEEAIIIVDEHSNILYLNNTALVMDSLVFEDVVGKHISEIYSDLNEKLLLPKVIEKGHAIIGERQQYATKYGKEITAISNNYPIIRNGEILGAYSLMLDFSYTENLLDRILELQNSLENQNGSKKLDHVSNLNVKYTFNDIIHNSIAMSDIIEKSKRVAKSDSSVMIYGETGTGKELFAQSIHNYSSRKNQPFIAINCAAVPESLLESTLFGTEAGAFTGAVKKTGLFEQANKGTLLLDEINSMSHNMQSKLLRVLQEGVIRKVGGDKEIPVDVRVLSNINKQPLQALIDGDLRTDLFYRLAVVTISIPPLNKRKEDIKILSNYFINNLNKKLKMNVHNLSDIAMNVFYNYSWPGNVRELEHVIEHAMNVMPKEDTTIELDYLPDHIMETAKESGFENIVDDSLKSRMDIIERQIILDALSQADGNITQAATSLGLSRQNLQYKIKIHDIDLEKI